MQLPVFSQCRNSYVTVFTINEQDLINIFRGRLHLLPKHMECDLATIQGVFLCDPKPR